MSTEKLLINLKKSYQSNSDWYKKVGDKGLSTYYQNEAKEVEKLIQIERSNNGERV